MNAKLPQLEKVFPQISFKKNEPLKIYTTLRIGGPADVFCIIETARQLTNLVKEARNLEIPITFIGSGSNILVSDEGIRGLVIKINTKKLNIGNTKLKVNKNPPENNRNLKFRWNSDKTKGRFIGIEFKDLNYDESDSERICVELDSGISLPWAIGFLIEKGITGLQWFAGIPGTIGGAVYNNVHGGSRFLGEFIDEVTLLGCDNNVKNLTFKDLGMDYDRSVFHNSKDLIIKTKLNLFLGDKKRAEFTASEWKKRKKMQPRNSPGCVFKNITNEEKENLGYPTTSTGYIVEHILKMRGYKIGDAKVSEMHCNFIVNNGNATAKEYKRLIELIQNEAKNKIGINLTPEIIFLGFDNT